MRYALIENGTLVEYPYSEKWWRKASQIRARAWADCPDETLASFGVYRVQESPPPLIDERTQVAVRASEPVLVDGVWTLPYVVTDKSGAEVAAFDNQIRKHIKKEAGRRIELLAPEWKQRNATARGLELTVKLVRNGVNALTPEEQAEEAAMDALWAEVKRLRGVSDTLEAMDPPPQDYADDKHWILKE